MATTAKLNDKKDEVTITLSFSQAGTPSKSQANMVHASTRGNQTVVIDGKAYKVGVNLYAER